MYLTLMKLDTTFIINEKDHVLFLQKKKKRKLVLPLLTWNSLDEITFMERNLKKVCILYNVSQNTISGVTLVYTDQNKVCIWYFIIKSRKNSDLFWFFSKMMKSHQTVIISRSELKERGSLSKIISIQWKNWINFES